MMVIRVWLHSGTSTALAAGRAQTCRASKHFTTKDEDLHINNPKNVTYIQIRLQDIKSDLFTEKIQHDKMQVFGRKV